MFFQVRHVALQGFSRYLVALGASSHHCWSSLPQSFERIQTHQVTSRFIWLLCQGLQKYRSIENYGKKALQRVSEIWTSMNFRHSICNFLYLKKNRAQSLESLDLTKYNVHTWIEWCVWNLNSSTSPTHLKSKLSENLTLKNSVQISDIYCINQIKIENTVHST